MAGITRRKSALVLTVLVLVAGISVEGQQHVAQPEADVSTGDLQGAWRQIGGEGLLNVKGDQLLSFNKGTLSIFGIVHRRQATLVLRNLGELETWQASVKDGVLRLSHGETKEYLRLKEAPPEIEVRPVKIPTPRPIPPGRVEEIQKEIAGRFQHEQKVLNDSSRASQAPALRAENLKYLMQVVQDVGWLDTGRFGEKTSVYATILLKHTGELPLSMAVLPYVEKDLKLTGDGQTYAVLYDSLQLQLGHKQRYGTQIGEDSLGNPYILPLENPAKVDVFLKEMGLPPLSHYMADVSKFLYNGKPVRLARPEESE
ncbi:MAG: DUF6624 domain-containing protein [bacterium]